VKPALERFRSTAVVVVGDVMLDEYVWGDVDRISPEAPVPVVRVRARTHVPGGAANAAAGVVALGGTALLVGVVGEDAAGEALRAELDKRRIGGERLVTSSGRATTTKTRVIAHNQQVVRTDVEELDAPGAAVETEVAQAVTAAIDGAQAVIVSDYGKGTVSTDVARAVISAASARGCPVIVDPKGADYAKYTGATVLTPNVHELQLATRVHVSDDASLVEAASALRAQLSSVAILVTRGAAGMSLFDTDGTRTDIAAVAQAVYDVTGAGDTVAAVLGVALGSGMPLREAAGLSNRAAGVVVGKVGTASVELSELDAAVS
jgi:rfaE bifunctional protein kinase chain/domain